VVLGVRGLQNLLSLVGNGPGQPSGVRIAQMGRQLDQRTGIGAGVPNESWRISATGVAVMTEDPVTVPVHAVRMIPKIEAIVLNQLEGYLLDGNGPDLMITGQLTRCSFVMRQQGNDVVCIHIEPGGVHPTSANLKTEIVNNGAFAHYPGALTRVFGLPDYAIYAYVLGIRRAGVWEIWAQHWSGTQITKVKKLL
jgi:hypothetical protein